MKLHADLKLPAIMDTVLSRYALEERFNTSKVVSYAAQRWHYSFYISGLYVLAVFALRSYMSSQQRFNLRLPLFMWSLTLALFSLLGSAVTLPVMLAALFGHGWEGSICGDVLTGGQRGLWAFLFCFSKFPELVDTLFIVLRKQKLIFLHWYHHVTVFIYCWYHYAVQLRPAQWFVTLNFVVHSIMYSYYALRASGQVRPPIWVNMFITVLQLLQMVVGVSINVFIYQQMGSDPTWHCDGQVETSYFYVYWSFAMYFSYFVLFANFFWYAYFCKSSPSSPSSASKENFVLANGSMSRENFTNGHIPNGLLSHSSCVT